LKLDELVPCGNEWGKASNFLSQRKNSGEADVHNKISYAKDDAKAKHKGKGVKLQRTRVTSTDAHESLMRNVNHTCPASVRP
jgi:hypothetical protein